MEKKQSSVELFAIALYEKGFLKGNGNEINDLLDQSNAQGGDNESCNGFWMVKRKSRKILQRIIWR